MIVAERDDGTPIVLAEWVLGEVWIPAEHARKRLAPFTHFRDRWRAKRQAWRLERKTTPRVIRLDRL